MTHKGQSTWEQIIFDCKDPWERLAMAIIMDGLRSHDKKYFYSDACANLFHALGIHGDPILYYAAYINQRKRGAKNDNQWHRV